MLGGLEMCLCGGRVEDRGLQVHFFALFVVILFKCCPFVDACGVKRTRSNGLRCDGKRCLVSLVIHFALLPECRMRVDNRWIANAGSIPNVRCSEDIVVFAFIHLNVTVINNQLYYCGGGCGKEE